MNKIFVFWRDDDQKKLLSWWSSLKDNHGWRAELRRAEKPEDVLLTKGFRSLYFELLGTKWIKEEYLLGLATAAGVMAHIEYNDTGYSFAESCAHDTENRKKPIVSELRFSQLQKSRSLEELFTRMRRTIKLLDSKASVVSVADCIMHWYREMVLGKEDAEPRNKIIVRWGLEYFQNLPMAENK
jgi:CRISPR system Cascade subunit CasB